MKIVQEPVGIMEVFCYLVYDEKSGEGVLIDPAGNEGELLEMISRLDVKLLYIVNTHGHPDHTCGNDRLRKATGAKVIMHHLDDAFSQRADMKQLSKMMGLDTTDAADIQVKDGDEITFGDITMKFIHTPGHTPGGTCVLIDGNLFTGDTLFVGAAGRTDLPGGSHAQLMETIRTKIASLPPDTVIWPGHDYGDIPHSTVAHELETNPYMDFADD